ncbi:LacI family transcriptional regulator [Parabacteroides sp. OttesenSCG-928-N08]|nr:LacI family transcriptional regulator [Parabacteroides sp. OttesenSCG-928-N08]
MKRTSIKDIAEKLNISTATVSLVLNGKYKEGRVSQSLAERIRITAEAMNYQPNTLARSLRMGNSQIIGLILADISNHFFSSLAFHIQEEAEKLGYSVIIANTNENDEKMETAINLFQNRQVDGFIIIPTEGSQQQINTLIDKNIPLVLLDRYFPFVDASHVIIDNYKASLEATKLLIEQGCKRIALVTYKNVLPHILERKSGFMDAMAYAGLSDSQQIQEIRYTHIADDMNNCIRELIDSPTPIEAILFSTNTISQLGIKALLKQGIVPQEDIKIACFDKNEAFDFMPVHIPCVMQPVAELGMNAVETLIQAIENRKKGVKEIVHIKLPTTIQ